MAPWRFKGILESEFGEEGSRAPQEVKAPSTSPICLPLTQSLRALSKPAFSASSEQPLPAGAP